MRRTSSCCFDFEDDFQREIACWLETLLEVCLRQRDWQNPGKNILQLEYVFNKCSNDSHIITMINFSLSVKLLLFYVVFYLFFTAIFAIHLSAFLAVTPHPGKEVTPWNFGKYAYPNYPNSKIGILYISNHSCYQPGSLGMASLTH